MSNKEPRDALGARDGETLLEAAKRVVRERNEARAEAASSLAMARIAGDKHDQKCAEVDVLRGVGCEEDGDGSCGVCRKCAYRRGAEAMREACAIRGGDKAYERMTKFRPLASEMKQAVRDAIRALPIPEDKP